MGEFKTQSLHKAISATFAGENFVVVAFRKPTYPLIQYEALLNESKEKTGEFFLAISKPDWEAFLKSGRTSN